MKRSLVSESSSLYDVLTSSDDQSIKSEKPLPKGRGDFTSTTKRMLHLAQLARLALSPEELNQFGKQSDDILNYMDILSEVDTTDVEPMYSPLEQVVSRSDQAIQKGLHNEVLANAPESDGHFFIVPRIV